MRRFRHWLAHLLGWNHCRVVGHLDLECVECGKLYLASKEFKSTMRYVTDVDIAQAMKDRGLEYHEETESGAVPTSQH